METNQILTLKDTFEGHAIDNHFVDVNKMVANGSAKPKTNPSILSRS